MSRLSLPINQKRFTNVALVKLKKAGKKFEVAAYCNKVVNWRNGVETDIDEVLQIEEVFTNTSRGVVAKAKDLVAAFGTDDRAACCRVVLAKGELQVGGLERRAAADSSFRDIAKIVAEKCVNPDSLRPYPVTVIERAMKGLGFAPNPNRGGKQQALELIGRLQCETDMPIERARMHLRLTAPPEHGDAIEAGVRGMEDCDVLVARRGAELFECECLVLPSCFRRLDELLRECCGEVGGGEGDGGGGGGAGSGRKAAAATLEVLRLAVQQEGETDVSAEVLRTASVARASASAASAASAQRASAKAEATAAAGARAEGEGGGAGTPVSRQEEDEDEDEEQDDDDDDEQEEEEEEEEEEDADAMLMAPAGRRAGRAAAAAKTKGKAAAPKSEQAGGKAKSKTALRKEAREARKAKKPPKQAGGGSKKQRGGKRGGGGGGGDGGGGGLLDASDGDEEGERGGGGGAAGAPPAAPPRAVVGAAVGALTASTAPGHSFASRDELRKHFSSDWHKCNLKRKVASLPMYTREEFSDAAAMQGGANAEVDAAEVDRDFFS